MTTLRVNNSSLDENVSIIQNNGSEIGKSWKANNIIYKDFQDLTKGIARKKRIREYWDHIEGERVKIGSEFRSKFQTCGLKRVSGGKNKDPVYVPDERLNKLLDLELLKDWDQELELHRAKLRELSNKEFLPYVKGCFADYIEEINRTRCVVLGKNKESGEWHGFEVFNRYSDHYKKELMSTPEGFRVWNCCRHYKNWRSTEAL